MADEDTVLEETMDDLKEAGGCIKELARSHQPSQLLVYKQNGTVQTEQTYG